MANTSLKVWSETARCFRAKWSAIFCCFGTLLFIIGVIVTSIGFAIKWDNHHHSTSLVLCVTGPVMIGCGFLPLILSCIFWTYVKPRHYTDQLQTSYSPESNLPSPPKSDVTSDRGSHDIDLGITSTISVPKVIVNKQPFLAESFVNSHKQNNQASQQIKDKTSISPSSENSSSTIVQISSQYQQRTPKWKDFTDGSPNIKFQSILKNNNGNNALESVLRHQTGSIQKKERHMSLHHPFSDGQQSSTSSDRSSRPIVKSYIARLQSEERQARRVSFDDFDTIYFTERRDNRRKNRRKISRTGGNYLTIY